MVQFLLIALSTFVSEDLTCIAAGALVAEGRMSLSAAVTACLLGIFIGDLLLVLAGRFGGRALAEWSPVRRYLPKDKLERASKWISERGLIVVLLSRFTPGLRLPTYFMAGVLKTRLAAFSLYLLIAAAIWTPLLVLTGTRMAGPGLALVVGGVFTARYLVRNRRRVTAFFARKVRWEFWPAWAAYLPLAPYLLFLAIKHRSPTLFMAANPGIPTGGFVGESKSEILRYLMSGAEGFVAKFEVIPAGREPVRVKLYPVVLKPDVGERGRGVAVIHSEEQLRAYLAGAKGDVILQEYVGGVEFGVFYYRYPGEPKGRISSITEKRFPSVTGDGRSTVRELIEQDSRAFCIADIYAANGVAKQDLVPAPGETVTLAEIGSHCRGAIFLDGGHLKSEALECAIDRVAKAHPGFFFGRFDVRAESHEAFSRGVFKVLELNGVSAEATHIYDPAVSLWQAYRVMAEQWRIAFEIGARARMLPAFLRSREAS